MSIPPLPKKTHGIYTLNLVESKNYVLARKYLEIFAYNILDLWEVPLLKKKKKGLFQKSDLKCFLKK